MNCQFHARNFVTALAILLVPATSFSAGKPVKCLIESEGSPSFKGTCLFLAEKGGSFTLSSVTPSKPLLDGASDISVGIIEKDVAEVRGLAPDGNNSRGGRSKTLGKRQGLLAWQ